MRIASISLLLCLSLAGCSSEGYQSLTVAGQAKQAAEKIDGQLKQVKIGMKQSEVVTLLGSPTKVNSTITAQVRSEQWIYTEDTLAQNLLGYMQRNSYTFMKTPMYTTTGVQVHGRTGDLSWYLYFENGVLTTMQEQQ